MWKEGGPPVTDNCVIISNLLAPLPPTPVLNVSIVSCMHEMNDNQSDNYEVEIHNLYLNWNIPNEANSELTNLHFQIWLGFDPISKSAQDVYEIVNVSSSFGKVKMAYGKEILF